MNVAAPIASTALKGPQTLASSWLDYADLLVLVESRMHELAGDRSRDPGAQMLREHFDTGGKRLRARLAIAGCQALGGRAADAVDWAAAVELIHNASLVHDDIQDRDRTRRGRPTLWARYGTAQAINAGDLLLMLPFRALRNYPPAMQAALIQILAEYGETTARGQIRELGLTASCGNGWGDYFSAASGKTGTLFALPVRGAAQLAGVSSDAANAIALAFSSIGVLYQLQDDLLDLFDAKGRGTRGSDICEGRLSAVLLTHLDLHPDDAQATFEIIGKPREQTTPWEVEQMIQRFIDGGAAEQLRSRIRALATDLLSSERLVASPQMQAIARELVHLVLAPLDQAKGSERD
ncbi:MAG: polyprenyl synthetase family protein [Polyangiales bacterium]